MICPNCKSQCDDNQMFCTKCGAKINTFAYKKGVNKEPLPSDEPFEDIIGGLSDDEDDVNDYIKRDLTDTENKTSQIREDDFDDDSYDRILKEPLQSHKVPKSKPVYEPSVKPQKTQSKRKKHSKKQKALVALITVLAVVIAVFATLAIKEATMTKKFNEYFSKGNQYYNEKNYKDAKTQYINASNNAFTKEQKVNAYSMVYKVDELIGGYDQEEIKYLESLLNVDDSNIEYYKALIILYQNNDLNDRIEPLVASAPANIKTQLENFDGTIPTASEKEGSYDKPIEVKLSATDNVTIYYTTDGSDVTDSSTKKKYTKPIKLDEEGTYTIRALSINDNKKSSKEMSVRYLLDFGSVQAPTVNLTSGKYTEQKSIEVSASDGCTIYYTTDGTTPSKKSQEYTEPIKLEKGDSLYYFIAVDSDGVYSNVVTRAYDYSPEYRYSYDDALSSLSSKLVSDNTIENKYGEFKDGGKAYFDYKTTVEIDDKFYYIISCEIEDKDGAAKSTKLYGVSCDTGSVNIAKASGNSYSLQSND